MKSRNIELQDVINKKTSLHFRIASLYSNQTSNTDMTKVRILPDMIGFEAEDLPSYANFNPTTVVRGVAEDKTKNVNNSTKLWVICTSDFKVGWIVGEATSQYSSYANAVDEPWPFNTFKNHIVRCHLNSNFAKYDELKVLFNNNTFFNKYTDAGIDGSPDTAISLDVVNVRTGERVMMLQSGTTFALTQKQILLRVGSPDSDVSTISMTAGRIEITANEIAIWGKNSTSLGKHGMKLCGMLGAPTAVDGSPIIGLLDISC